LHVHLARVNNNNITAFVQIHLDHVWTHQVVHVYPSEVCLSMVYPLSVNLPHSKLCRDVKRHPPGANVP
jgi:hypothetical protein